MQIKTPVFHVLSLIDGSRRLYQKRNSKTLITLYSNFCCDFEFLLFIPFFSFFLFIPLHFLISKMPSNPLYFKWAQPETCFSA